MKQKVKKFLYNNKSIILTCVVIFVLAIGLVFSSSFAEDDMATRTLYRNQYFLSDSEMSDTVLSTSPTGTTNFTHGPGPNGEKFLGFALNKDGVVKYASVDAAAKSQEEVLYSVYEGVNENVTFVNLDEDTGKPISGSEFKLIGQEFEAVSVSDKSGKVEFYNVPNGKYKLINTKASGDYTKLKKEIEIKVGG